MASFSDNNKRFHRIPLRDLINMDHATAAAHVNEDIDGDGFIRDRNIGVRAQSAAQNRMDWMGLSALKLQNSPGGSPVGAAWRSLKHD